MVSLADCGNLIVHRQGDIRGGVERETYEIEGGPYVAVSNQFSFYHGYPNGYPTKPGGKFKVGPYKFRTVSYDFWADSIVAIQEKWPLWWIAVAWHRSSKLLDIFYRRIIVTLAVWRLADYHEATVPYIGDIHIVQRIRKLFNGKRISD